MTAATSFRLRPLLRATLFAALAATACGVSLAQAPATDLDGQARRLATDDAQLQRARWGDLALAAGKTWLFVAPGEIANVWRDVHWEVPGSVLKYHRGFCLALKCEGTQYVVRFNEQARQLDFFDGDQLAYVGRVQGDGSVRISGASLLGVLTAETLRLDPATNVLSSDQHEMTPSTPARLAEVTHGLAGGSVVPTARVPASAPAPSEADLRAELAAMKAKVDALSKQVEQQQQQPTKPMTAAEKREAERAAKAKALEEQRLAREAKAREEAQRRAEAQAKAREEAQRAADAKAREREEALARAAEAKRQAEEKRLQALAEAQAAAEAKKRAAEEKAAEARRVADEKAAEAKRAADAKRMAQGQPAVPAQAIAAKQPARPATRGESCGGAEGLYGTGDNYRIEVSFEGDVLKVREPNRLSTYEHLGQCQFGFTHPNGTSYRMGVSRGMLVAYKEGMSPSQGTPLNLLQPKAAPQAAGQCKAEPLVFQNAQSANPEVVDKLYGIRDLGGYAARVDGTYRAPERDGHPITTLGPNGQGGTFEVYGAPRAGFDYPIKRWWIQANCDGTPIVEKGPAGSRYMLIYELERPYQGRLWQRDQIIVVHAENKMFMIDREKTKN